MYNYYHYTNLDKNTWMAEMGQSNNNKYVHTKFRFIMSQNYIKQLLLKYVIVECHCSNARIHLTVIGVGAQSTLGGKTFLPEHFCLKNTPE